MSLKRSALVLAFLSCTLTAAADTHKIDGEAAIAYAELSNVFGFKTSFARTLAAEGKLHSWAVEGQFTGHFLGDDDSEIGAFLGPAPQLGHRPLPGRGDGARGIEADALRPRARRRDAPDGRLRGGDRRPGARPRRGLRRDVRRSYRTGVRFSLDWVVAGGKDFPRASIGLVYRVPYSKGAHRGH